MNLSSTYMEFIITLAWIGLKLNFAPAEVWQLRYNMKNTEKKFTQESKWFANPIQTLLLSCYFLNVSLKTACWAL